MMSRNFETVDTLNKFKTWYWFFCKVNKDLWILIEINWKFFVTFSALGSQSRDWREASVTITTGSAYRVVFEVVNGNRRGDIAIDDYSVTPGACGVKGNCNFDQGFCTWTNDHAYDSFDWALGHGSTASSNTGPTNDHTQGNSKGE